jgi:hypothetical protein
MLLPSSGSKNKPSKKPRLKQMAGRTYSSSWRWRRHVSPKYLMNFNGLHGAISQKIKFFLRNLCFSVRKINHVLDLYIYTKSQKLFYVVFQSRSHFCGLRMNPIPCPSVCQSVLMKRLENRLADFHETSNSWVKRTSDNSFHFCLNSHKNNISHEHVHVLLTRTRINCI